ncbi:cell division protein FtsL [Erysipelothrix rhusiopathiae]|uniref:Cell division protein FtsL n=2 Tax=Erysipelothrix TaxID=1647 RepID=E7FU06_ERYRH|nr:MULTISPECIES: cell division protein FtsL [Erysipelothrix]UPU39234.1 cell division protein FtsL [Erysipelothrix sp. Poltava]CAH2761743.1 cell division protein FtsL [Erysipelothrix sp. A18Y020d]AGN23763.1 cell division protein FtsL [Erysipelothrix rhusiopathiae SY1027]AMS11467.1 cell division protein FtsL [Erysipelothrix rhusiopathiae]AOO67965.1 cell division protein FtsL [Erysipelothrix rhusiopathiae]
MAKHVIKRKKKTIRWSGLVGFVFTMALLFSFVTQIFVRSENARLAREIQVVKQQQADINVNNEKLTAEIQDLSDSNRVVSIATEAGLDNTHNVVTVKHGD